jgi:hypothetical protein
MFLLLESLKNDFDCEDINRVKQHFSFTHIVSFCVCACGTGVWTQGLNTLSHSISPSLW